jgi:hypothetical protein
MNAALKFSLLLALGLSSTLFAQANAPLRLNGMLVTDFITTPDGVLDSSDDLIYDADSADPAQPEVLAQVFQPDGTPLTWGQFQKAQGEAAVKCMHDETHIVIKTSGLIPHGVYTAWLMTFAAPGFTPDFAYLIGEGALGAADGSENIVIASASGEGQLAVFQPAGALSEFGEVTGCLTDEFEFMIVLVYHPDGKTYGPTPAPVDADNPFAFFVEHLAFDFVSGL